MENSERVMFEDDSEPQWYIALGERWIGPLTAADVYEKVTGGEISWAHYVWRKGQKDWRRICDVETFQAAVPTVPGRSVQQEVKTQSTPVVKKAAASKSAKGGASKSAAPKPPQSVLEPKVWYLHYNESQFGPFSFEEVARFLRVGKIHGRVHAWQDGMSDWQRLESIEGFEEAVAESKRVRDTRKRAASKASIDRAEKRGAPRRPLVARIFLANEDSVIVGICRDISVGGMQVLTDRIPGEVGGRLRMNVSPSGDEGSIQPFVAEGVIVRILEDGRGFSFRFERLPAQSRKVIEDYISSSSG